MEVEEWDQLLLIPNAQGSLAERINGTPRRRALKITKCRQCSQLILEPYLQGTAETVTKKVKGQTERVSHSGRKLKLEPEPVVDGRFFIVSKTAHRRQPDDTHPSLLFYAEHRCLGA